MSRVQVLENQGLQSGAGGDGILKESDIPGVLLESPLRKALICLTTETTISQHVTLAFQLSARNRSPHELHSPRGDIKPSRPMVLALLRLRPADPHLHTDLLVPFSTLLSSPLAPVSKALFSAWALLFHAVSALFT